MALKTSELKYNHLQKLRELMIEEVKELTANMTVEHYQLVEMRLQTLLLVDDIDLVDIAKKIKDKKNV